MSPGPKQVSPAPQSVTSADTVSPAPIWCHQRHTGVTSAEMVSPAQQLRSTHTWPLQILGILSFRFGYDLRPTESNFSKIKRKEHGYTHQNPGGFQGDPSVKENIPGETEYSLLLGPILLEKS